jgi:hypothetical protein
MLIDIKRLLFSKNIKKLRIKIFGDRATNNGKKFFVCNFNTISICQKERI